MTIVFCFTRIFRNSHRQIFGLDKLLEEGHNIILLDLSEMYGGNPTCDDELMLGLRERISNKTQLIEFKKSMGSEPVIYVCNDTYLNFAHDAFQLLMRKQDRLLAFKTKPSPFQIQNETGIKLLLKESLIKLPISPKLVTKSLYQRYHKYFVPDYFLVTSKFDLPLKALLTLKKENIIIAHSDDVNDILEDKTEVQIQERIGVFLDQILPFAHRGKLDINTYYENIGKTLAKLMEQFNLDKIVIAEHPESVAVEEELKDKYKGFERYRGNTQKLIKNSTHVFAHYSTSIGLAVYYNKPVVLLIDANLRKVAWISKAVNTYRKILDLPMIDMEKRNISELEGYAADKKLYNSYVKKYMKDSEIKERSYHYALNRIIQDIDNKKL